jgi:hypothetical protein
MRGDAVKAFKNTGEITGNVNIAGGSMLTNTGVIDGILTPSTLVPATSPVSPRSMAR